MPTLTLTDEQALELVKQLPPDQQELLLSYLLARQWPAWANLSQDGQEQIRALAARRGRNWDALTEEERIAFVDDLVHEDR